MRLKPNKEIDQETDSKTSDDELARELADQGEEFLQVYPGVMFY